jgi:catechol-2,3-dioxygenase
MSTSAETSIPTPRLAHVVLRTKKYQEMQDFWITLLNAEVAYKNDSVCFLRYDDEHHRIAIATHAGLDDVSPSAVGLDHIAFTFESFGDLIRTYLRLEAAGLTPTWTVNHGPTLSMYYTDPDGNRGELQIDRFRTVEEANAFMASEIFERNPIGITLDPADLARRFLAGEPVESLTAYQDQT